MFKRVLAEKYVKNIFFVFSVIFILTAMITLFFGTGFSKAANQSSQTSDLQVKVSQVLSFSLQNCDSSNSSTLNIDIIPTTTGSFKSACQTANIHTNAPGYTLTTKASSTTLNYLNPTTVTPKPTINPTTNTTTSPNTLTNETWGFAAQNRLNFDSSYTTDNASNKYAALPTTDTTIYQTDQHPLPITQHKFYYATKLTPETMAGTYSTTITYTAVANEITPAPTRLAKVVNGGNFQDTTLDESQTCSALPIYPAEGSTIIMTDTRNNQQYRVRRLQDGKCWMIDNLKLELTNGMTLTPADTNVTENTTIYFTQDGTSTGAALTGMTGNWTTSGYMTRDGTDADATPNFDAWRQADPSNTINCLNNTGTNTTNAYNPNSKTNCGYLYNWYTATAGSRPQNEGVGHTTESICPAGWHLPYSTSTNDFAVLNGYMAGLGTSSASSYYFANWLSDGAFEGSLAGYFGGSFYNYGNYGYNWGGRAESAVGAYIVYYQYSNVNPGSTSYNKSSGGGVRCIL